MAQFSFQGFTIDMESITEIYQTEEGTTVHIGGIEWEVKFEIGLIIEGYWNFLKLSKDDQTKFIWWIKNLPDNWSPLVKLLESQGVLSIDGRVAYGSAKDHIRIYHVEDTTQD